MQCHEVLIIENEYTKIVDLSIWNWLGANLLTRGSIPDLRTPLLLPPYPSAAMPPKKSKKDADVSDDKFMRAARFGRVKNDLRMGFVVSISRCCKSWLLLHHFSQLLFRSCTGPPQCWQVNPHQPPRRRMSCRSRQLCKCRVYAYIIQTCFGLNQYLIFISLCA